MWTKDSLSPAGTNEKVEMGSAYAQRPFCVKSVKSSHGPKPKTLVLVTTVTPPAASQNTDRIAEGGMIFRAPQEAAKSEGSWTYVV